LNQSSLGLIDLGLIKVKPGVEVNQVVDQLTATLPDDVIALSNDGFIQLEKSYNSNRSDLWKD
jgi:putative ABC transport system permease protein